MATKSSSFTQAVVRSMRKLYPEELADKSFDNTGLLLEAPEPPTPRKNTVLLTIDLTKAVADEAINRGHSVVVAYHPIIFRPLKSLTLANSQQSTLLRLAQAGVSVYSPHTAVDASPRGLGPFLADVVTGAWGHTRERSSPLPHHRTIINPSSAVSGLKEAGSGRIVRFDTPQPLGQLVKFISEALFLGPGGLSVATPQSIPSESKLDTKISSIGICAGSGGSMLNGLDVDMLFTGELSHHEALAAIEVGRVVVTTFHSNSERAFLENVMARDLLQTLGEEGVPDPQGSVVVSQADRDPYEIVALNDPRLSKYQN